MSGRLVAVTLGVMVVAVGTLGMLVWRHQSKAARNDGGHFTLPGWEDVFIGGNPVKDTPCKFLERAKADNCVGSRVAGIGQIGQIEMLRRSDVGVAVIIAQLDKPAAAALRKRWGTPRGSTTERTTWCSPDGREGAFLNTRDPEYVAPTVVITMTDRAQDLIDDLPMETASCEPARARHKSPSAPASPQTATRTPPPALITRFDGASVTASSSHAPAAGYTFVSENLVDNDVTTSWQPDPADNSPSIELDFGAAVTITEVRVANGFQRNDRFGDQFMLNARISRGRLHFDDGSELRVEFAADARGFVAHSVPAKRTRRLKLQIDGVWPGTKWQDLAISEVEVRGHCECWVQVSDAAEPRRCDDSEMSVWLETGPCD